MLFNRFCHAFQSCFNDAAWHCKVQTNISFRIADEQIIAAFQQNACVICKESGQIRNIRRRMRNAMNGLRNLRRIWMKTLYL